MTVSLVIPFYNEAGVLPETAAACLALRQSSDFELELIFVDDGSTDGGGALLSGLPVRLAANPRNMGKGAAVRRGVALSSGDVVLYTDCDLAYGLDVVGPAVRLLRDSGADVVCGSRRLNEGGYTGYPPLRRAASACFALFVRAALGLSAGDTQCGFKCMRGEAARRLFADCVTDGFSFDLEMLARARAAGMKIVELPVRMLGFGSSSVRVLRHSVEMAGEVLAIRRLIRGGCGPHKGGAA